MKKFLFLLISFSFISCFSQTQTFNTPPKFKNVVQNDLNTKILSINSTTNKLEWVNKNSFVSPTPSLQLVTNQDNSTTNSIQVTDGINNSIYTSTGLIVFDSSNSVQYTNNGVSIENIPGTLKAGLNLTDGLFLKTNVNGFEGKINTSNLTANRNWQVEDRDGKIAIAMVTGTANLGLGDEALDTSPSTGSYNLAVGVGAATNLSEGSKNTAIGNFAMYLSTSSDGNVAVGTSALQNHTTGNYNTAIGSYALGSRVGNLTGSNNIGIGFQAGRAVTSGSNNILIENTTNDGISTGNFNIILNGRNKSGVTTGSGNVIIGGYNGVFSPTMAETIIIGTGTGTQRLTIDSTGLVKLVSGAPVYANNSAAISGGLVAGNIYRTSTGQLMIVY